MHGAGSHASGNSRRATVLALALALLLALVAPGLVAPARADPDATADDASVPVSTGSWAYSARTPAQIDSLVAANGARLTSVRAEPGGTTFAVTMVANTGQYRVPTWWWYSGRSIDEVSGLLAAQNGRLISLDPYYVGGALRFAVVMVPNAGPTARLWQWIVGETAQQILDTAAAGNSRPVEVRPYTANADGSGGTFFATIYLAQTGNDAKPWALHLGETAAQIAARIVDDGLRPTSIAADPSGGFDTVYVSSLGYSSHVYTAATGAGLLTAARSAGERLVDLTPYRVGSTTAYAGIGLDNTNRYAAPAGAESQRVKGYLTRNGWAGSLSGAYLSLSGSGTALVSAAPDFRYEPASATKVLYLLFALQQVQAGREALASTFTYYPDPSDPAGTGVCPRPEWETPANARTTTLQKALQQMMRVSDNRMTRGMALRYGLPAVNAMADGLGMSRTELRQPFIGCGFDGGVRNDVTLGDLARLYQAVDRNTALNATTAKVFWGTLNGGAPAASSPLGKVVAQEAAKQGRSSVVTAFLAAMDFRSKGGSYAFCAGPGCSPYVADLSTAGRLVVPFRSGGVVQPRRYLVGDFTNDLVVPCVPGSGCAAEKAAFAAIDGGVAEAARTVIRSALTTW